MTAVLGPTVCRLGCREVEFGLHCTAQPTITPTGDQPILHPADLDCIDTIVHRSQAAPHWHTNKGTTQDHQGGAR